MDSSSKALIEEAREEAAEDAETWGPRGYRSGLITRLADALSDALRDKERLDWLIDGDVPALRQYTDALWTFEYSDYGAATPRLTIDAAMAMAGLSHQERKE